jgi:hypothetical protein
MAVAPQKYRANPDPELITVHLAAGLKLDKAKEGGWTYPAIAQVYNQVNDRLMIFKSGGAKKTIKERVKTGRVKIEHGHPWSMDKSAKTTCGLVLDAEEKPDALYYTGFLSKTEGDLVTKMEEGIIDENSLVLYVLQEGVAEVEISEVPEMSRTWVTLTPKGKAQVRLIKEWAWLAIGLLPASSQGVPCLIDPPRLVPYQDLPLAAVSTAWDASAAAARVAAWATDPRNGEMNHARLASGYLARGAGQGSPAYLGGIADVVNGELVVVPHALESAYRELETMFGGEPAALAAAARTIGRYEGRLLTGDTDGADDLASSSSVVTDEQAQGRPATPPAQELGSSPTPVPARPASPPAGPLADRSAQERAAKLRSLQVDLLSLELGGVHEPGRASSELSRGGGAGA